MVSSPRRPRSHTTGQFASLVNAHAAAAIMVSMEINADRAPTETGHLPSDTTSAATGHCEPDREEVPGQPGSFYAQANPRIGLNKGTIAALRTGGIPDSKSEIAAFANEAIQHVIRSGQSRKPNLADLIALEAALGHRIEEMNILLLGILQNIVDLAGLAERKSLLGVFAADLAKYHQGTV
jgi:hypothetical protein